MNSAEILLVIAEVLEQEPEAVQSSASLADYDWDSLSILSFIALVQERFHLVLSPSELVMCETVDDLMRLVAKESAAEPGRQEPT